MKQKLISAREDPRILIVLYRSRPSAFGLIRLTRMFVPRLPSGSAAIYGIPAHLLRPPISVPTERRQKDENESRESLANETKKRNEDEGHLVRKCFLSLIADVGDL